MSASHFVRSLSSINRAQPTQNTRFRRSATQRLVSLSPLNQNRTASSIEPAKLIANEPPIDPTLLAHENPNECQSHELASPLPLDKYRLNIDPQPMVVRRKPHEKVHYCQHVAVRYLKPPPPPKSGDLVIREMPARQVAPAPALIVRQAPPKASTPPPLILREAPPQPPNPLPSRLVHVPGKVVPPPARKVVVERLPPIPPKPQQIFIERWLPYGQQHQRVVYQPAKPRCWIPNPKNVVIQWDAPDVEIRQEVKNLGVIVADPAEYVRRYGPSLIQPDRLPEIAHRYANGCGLQLACHHQPPEIPILEGDIHALQFIDLEQVGLGRLKTSNHFAVPPSIPEPMVHRGGSPIINRISSPLIYSNSAGGTTSAAAAAAVASAVSAAANAATAASSAPVAINSTGLGFDEEIYLSSFSSEQHTQNHSSTAAQSHDSVVTSSHSILNTLSSSEQT